ncbi:neutral zinc metallopeptidase [Actinokineospora bangkokensis]|uniref:neutral zinc metallopeptidase n=1 Tax=Actinokineospora bangkokensis TaxID=1193682 RepID=UPI0011783AF7|nr:neutral zinc metallopeptidase [Actinokineospora bangkokensis]
MAISLVLLLFAGVALFGFIAANQRHSRTADVGYQRPPAAPTYSAPEDPTTTTTRTTTTTTRAGATTTRTTTTTRSTTTTTQSGPKPVYTLADNPLFSASNGVNEVTCNLPAWRNDPASSQAFFTAALPCLEQAWAPAMQRAGLPYSTPGLQFPSGSTWESPCGSASGASWAAFYCPQNNTIYMPFEGLQTDQNGTKSGVYLAVFAHEFGHHIQALSGVLDAYWDTRYEAGDQTAQGLELSRRSELQAQCFGGMWFAGGWNGGGSITDPVVRDMLADGYNRGDWNQNVPRDHGSPQHYGAWQEHGYKNNRTGPCNTWAAAAADVS